MTERCPWCGDDPVYVAYHDEEWGVPDYNALSIWEKLVLESFQAGLSWITILRKRQAFRDEFENFDPEKLAGWSQNRIEKALSNPGIIRHRGKISATVNSARLFLEIESGQGFAPFLWDFVDGKPIQNDLTDARQIPAQTAQSVALSKTLKARGFNFCGPVIVYAFMQATGMVNDHLTCCYRHEEVKALSSA